MRQGVTAAAIIAGLLVSSFASADIQHVVGKGHTLEAIANRYHVTVKAIMEANHLKDAKHLKPGDVLTIPKADTPKKPAKEDAKTPATGKDAKAKSGAAEGGGPSFAMKAKTPGIVHIHRLATTEDADVRISDGGGKVSTTTLKSFEKMMRSPAGPTHAIEPRLISLLGVVSNHFGSRKIEVISGFRPYTPTQYTKDSNHNHGKAVDFRVVGVPNEVVRDFCRTLKNTGCGYYPNSTFVHMDVRESSAFWIDYAKPGEPPRYNAPNVDADEGTSDVHGEAHPAANTQPATPPSEETPSESDPPPATKPNED
jgi:uncharacterized protein YcbK (DUF882 family)